jgi:replication factor A2
MNGGAAAGAGGDIGKAIVQYVKGVPATQGVSRNEIINGLKHVGASSTITAAIDALCSEGHLYTTVDEEHFKFSG